MFEVTFWRDGVEKTIADKFDNMQDALDHAREGVEYGIFIEVLWRKS